MWSSESNSYERSLPLRAREAATTALADAAGALRASGERGGGCAARLDGYAWVGGVDAARASERSVCVADDALACGRGVTGKLGLGGGAMGLMHGGAAASAGSSWVGFLSQAGGI